MTRFYLLIISSLLCAASWSCAPSANVPPAPDLSPVLEEYENPTANVRSEVMAAVADEIATLRDEIEDSDIFNEILDFVIDVQMELDEATDDDGNVTIANVAFPSPNGVLRSRYCCPGWGVPTDCDDLTNGTVDLTMTLVGGRLGPIVWGTADQCRYPVETDNGTIQSSFDGEVALHLGDFVTPDQSLRELLITFLLTGTIGLDGEDFPITQSFRVSETGRLDILVRLEDTKTFIYAFDGDSLAQGITDATGSFGCSLEDRECLSPSGTFSW